MAALLEVWEAHTRYEFADKDVDATMRTMVAEPHVIHVPVASGGRGGESVRDFYATWFIGRSPNDVQLQLISRTVGESSIVDEMIFSFTHDIDMPWMLPGIAPTGRKVAIPLVAIISFAGDKVESEHIYWDQASVLAQVGLLDEAKLPVLGRTQATFLTDAAAALNPLAYRA